MLVRASAMLVAIAVGIVRCGGRGGEEPPLVGIGAVVLPRVSIGHDAIVGGGAVVTADVPDGATVVGVPAKALIRQ